MISPFKPSQSLGSSPCANDSPLEPDSPKLLRDIGFHNLHAIQLLLPLGRLIHHIVFAEMLDILRVGEILLGGIGAVEFLEMVDFVFVLVVAVVAGAEAKVGQDDAVGAADGEFGKGDAAAAVVVEE